MTSTPSRSSSSALSRGPVSIGGWWPGRTTSIGWGSKVSTTRREAELARTVDGGADDLLVAAVHAVEDADGHDAPPPAGRRALHSPPALHVLSLPRGPGRSRPGRQGPEQKLVSSTVTTASSPALDSAPRTSTPSTANEGGLSGLAA